MAKKTSLGAPAIHEQMARAMGKKSIQMGGTAAEMTMKDATARAVGATRKTGRARGDALRKKSRTKGR